MELVVLDNEELLEIDGGSIFKYIGAVGSIGFGVYEVYTGIGAVNGAKHIAGGVFTIGAGIYALIS